MPYVNAQRRKELDNGAKADTAGALNYKIHRLIDEYMEEQDAINYEVINSVVGALECAKLELYRRLAIPYEDSKRREHGDVKPYNRFGLCL